jgi:glucose-6-phosphate 1-dehydrogenase
LRDVLQNHVMEVLSFVAMEPPDSFESGAVRTEKLKVWHAIDPIQPEDTVRGQYGPGRVDGEKVIGYREEDRVDSESDTETFVAMKLQIENWRWAGVPIYIRAGKRMAKRVTEVTVCFKQPPMHMFKSNDTKQVKPNILKMRIQPDEGISLTFGAKVPGPTTNVMPVEMHFSYAESFGKSSANGYERLLLDAMLGDGTLFAHRDGVEATWALMTPILEAWDKRPPTDFPNYEAGSWGPAAADALMKRDRRKWYKL